MSKENPLSDALAGRTRRQSKQRQEATEEATGADSVRLNAEVPPTLYEAFREVCDANERTISGQIRAMMREAVDEHRSR